MISSSNKVTITAGALFASLSLVACQSSDGTDDAAVSNANIPEDSSSACEVRAHESAIKWQQKSAEARALQEQTYKFAAERLDQIEDEQGSAGKAIVTDLDETAIDNSDLLARDMKECHDFTSWDTWEDWEISGDPRAIPGALEFFQEADRKGFEVIYLSDRTQENLSSTVSTLEELDFPNVSPDTVLLKGEDKESRRQMVLDKYDIVMLLGDTLHDFSNDYADTPVSEQRDMVDDDAGSFGTEWIIFPNPMYGSWEKERLDYWSE